MSPNSNSDSGRHEVLGFLMIVAVGFMVGFYLPGSILFETPKGLADTGGIAFLCALALVVLLELTRYFYLVIYYLPKAVIQKHFGGKFTDDLTGPEARARWLDSTGMVMAVLTISFFTCVVFCIIMRQSLWNLPVALLSLIFAALTWVACERFVVGGD
jgi:hypothetical protein